jgi:hypothetical protein
MEVFMRSNITTTSSSMPTHDSTAYTALKIGFVIAPLVAGLDKFFNILTDWTKYLAPVFNELLNVSPATFMMGVGVIEIVAGLGVLFKPKIFAFVVCAWMVGIICNLMLTGNYYDIALRDLGLAIGAFALGELAVTHEATEPRTHRRMIRQQVKITG